MEFEPFDVVSVNGIIIPSFSDGLVISTDTNRFNCKWFYNGVSKAVRNQLKMIYDLSLFQLQAKNYMPKEWPEALVPNKKKDDAPFHYEVVSIRVYKNPSYSGDIDRFSCAVVKASSRKFNTSSTAVGKLEFEDTGELFDAVEKMVKK